MSSSENLLEALNGIISSRIHFSPEKSDKSITADFDDTEINRFKGEAKKLKVILVLSAP